jgi:ABC-type sugar transport system substrate-binding protein
VSTLRRRRSRATLASAALATGLLLAACSGAESNGAAPAGGGDSSSAGGSSLPKTLVFSPLSLQPPALKGLSVGVQGYGKSKGWKVQVQDPNFDPNKQAQSLNAVISSGVAGALWVIAVNPGALSQTVRQAQAKGIPILLNGVPADYGFTDLQPGITFDVIDYKAYGTAMGQYLGKCITEKLGGNAQVLFAQSAVGTAGKADIEGSAATALAAAAPNAKVVSTIIAKDRAGSQTDIGNALQGHPDITAVMSTNDEGALGGLGAFAAAGKNLGCLTEAGGNDEVLGLVKSGKIYASVALQFAADTTQSFDTLVTMQGDPKAVGKQLNVPQKIITAAG